MTEQAKVPAIRFAGFTDPWEQRKLGELFDYEQPQPYIVRGTEYDDSFPTPVLTAGQSFVLGYTNEKQGIKMASPEHPVIIFDDFTTSSHFVDFPFKVKSSAIKLLTLRDKNEDIHFAYQVLQNIAYTPVSHERHWISKFATFATLMPECKSEMQAIGHFMSNLDGLITLHQRKYDKLCVLKKSMLDKMFPKGGSLYPEIRFAGFTDPWEQRKLGQHLKLSRELGHTGVDARKLTVKLWGKGVVEKTDLYGGSAQTQYYIRHAGQFMYGKLDFLHAAFGVVPDKLDCFESTLDSPAFDIEGLDSSFLLNLVTQEDFYLKNGNIANGSRKAKRIHEETFLNMEIRAPELVEQRRIGAFLDRLDSLITLHQRKLELLRNIKKSMLDKMFV